MRKRKPVVDAITEAGNLAVKHGYGGAERVVSVTQQIWQEEETAACGMDIG